MKSNNARAQKNVASPLDVYVWMSSPSVHQGFALAGEMTLIESGSTASLLATFNYNESYRHSPGAYPLDPINLPLLSGAFTTNNAFLRLGSIFDAAPDAWGRRVIEASKHAALDGGTYERAFLRGADGIGAILLKPGGETKENGNNQSTQQSLVDLVNRSRNERPTLSQLNDAAIASRNLELAHSMSDDQLSLLAGSWTIGGARPKAIVRNEGTFPLSEPLSGKSLIAKFPSENESIDRAAIEWVCLRMARDMGFNVPGHAFAQVVTGRALILERFDRYTLNKAQSELEEGRHHYVSANSMVSSLHESKRLDSMHDRIVFSFGNLMSIASRVSAKPKEARFEMFSRLLLNTMLHNTDDHLKNFGFIQKAEPGNFELAPVFDVSVQGLNEHFLHMNSESGRKYTSIDVMEKARSLGIAHAAALQARERILDVLSKRFDYYDEAQVPLNQRDNIERLIHTGTGDVLRDSGRQGVRSAPKG